MAFELATALFGLGGTIVGGGITFAANWLTARNQRVLADNTRIQAVYDRRVETHRDLLVRTDQFMESARVFRAILIDMGESESITRLHAAHLEKWTALFDVKAPATMAGPPSLDAYIASLFEALEGYSAQLEFWRDQGQTRNANAIDEEAGRRMTVVHRVYAEYVDAVRTATTPPERTRRQLLRHSSRTR
ncbi:MAG: hypothetical protein JWN03_7445 [Nocardia sp.]|uniref:hypothetical protein n=1 Tax=Nocardia sp. TaxID=1821 RepID=UPI0026209BF1|nr:hypothetical protein [Nocardia sp.]MCU1647170.1 hypothetical protein [Nocardia sp.]